MQQKFLEKSYKDKTTEDDMIGHFGLGFYSAFMVAEEVHIDTLSYKEGAAPVHWTCDGGTEYDMEEGSKNTVGTEITLFLNEESVQFSNEYRVREVIEKLLFFHAGRDFPVKRKCRTRIRDNFWKRN